MPLPRHACSLPSSAAIRKWARSHGWVSKLLGEVLDPLKPSRSSQRESGLSILIRIICFQAKLSIQLPSCPECLPESGDWKKQSKALKKIKNPRQNSPEALLPTANVTV